MVYESVATLCAIAGKTHDDQGNEIITYNKKDVFCRVRSVYNSEFYNAAQVGLHPSIYLDISTRGDYHGEKVVEFEGAIYDVIRADWGSRNEEITLVLESRTGSV